MSNFHAIADARPLWACDSEEVRADRADVALYLRRLFLPLYRDGEVLVVALVDFSPENICWLEAAYGAVRFLEVSRAELVAEIARRFEPALEDRAIFSLARERPELSARRVISPGQLGALTALLLIACGALWAWPLATLAVFVVTMTLLFIAGTFFRVLLSWVGGLPDEQASELARNDDPTLPVFSVLVPLYREARIVPGLLCALLSLKYPREKLDIKIIVEADDADTVRVCDELNRLRSFEVVRVPPSQPRTKPKAVNYALHHARGDYLVIYDAEDRPEPDQLLKSVSAFRRLPRRVACLQARLAFHNQDRWLTNGIMAQTPLGILDDPLGGGGRANRRNPNRARLRFCRTSASEE